MTYLGLAVCIPLVLLVLYFYVVRPFLQGIREANDDHDRGGYRIPERCPMCGAETLLTRELRCVHCGEDLGPPATH
ncbi:MAG: hypothetical protein ACE5KM_00030 [Planctomycetaceae bacterium]